MGSGCDLSLVRGHVSRNPLQLGRFNTTSAGFQIGNLAVLGLLAIGIYRYIQCCPIHNNFTDSHCRRIYYWFLLLALFACYGILRGNELVTIGKESTAFCYIGFFLVLGGDDRFWAHLRKPLTALFYIGAFLVVSFANTPAVQVAEDAVTQNLTADVSVAHRNIFSLGYTLRPLMASGLLLGIWGLVSKQKGLWRNLQMAAPVVLFACEVGLFLFRSTGAYVVLAGASYLILCPVFERRVHMGRTILVLCAAAIGVTVFAATETSDYFLARLSAETQKEGLFESRNAELGAYLDDLRWETISGRGIGGTFDAFSAFLRPGEDAYAREALSKWATLHYGVLVFALKGGVLMLALFISLLMPGFRRRSRDWYRNRYNLTAALLFPTAA